MHQGGEDLAVLGQHREARLPVMRIARPGVTPAELLTGSGEHPCRNLGFWAHDALYCWAYPMPLITVSGIG